MPLDDAGTEDKEKARRAYLYYSYDWPIDDQDYKDPQKARLDLVEIFIDIVGEWKKLQKIPTDVRNYNQLSQRSIHKRAKKKGVKTSDEWFKGLLDLLDNAGLIEQKKTENARFQRGAYPWVGTEKGITLYEDAADWVESETDVLTSEPFPIGPLTRLEPYLQRNQEESARFFRKGGPLWVDLEHDRVVEHPKRRRLCDAVVGNEREGTQVAVLVGDRATGKTALIRDLGFRLAKEGHSIYVSEAELLDTSGMKSILDQIDWIIRQAQETSDPSKLQIIVIENTHLQKRLVHGVLECVFPRLLETDNVRIALTRRGQVLRSEIPDQLSSRTERILLDQEDFEHLVEAIYQAFLSSRDSDRDSLRSTITDLVDVSEYDLWSLGYALRILDQSGDVSKEDIYGEVKEDLEEIENDVNNQTGRPGAAQSLLAISPFTRNELGVRREFLSRELDIAGEVLDALVHRKEVHKRDDRLYLPHPALADLYVQTGRLYGALVSNLLEETSVSDVSPESTFFDAVLVEHYRHEYGDKDFVQRFEERDVESTVRRFDSRIEQRVSDAVDDFPPRLRKLVGAYREVYADKGMTTLDVVLPLLIFEAPITDYCEAYALGTTLTGYWHDLQLDSYLGRMEPLSEHRHRSIYGPRYKAESGYKRSIPEYKYLRILHEDDNERRLLPSVQLHDLASPGSKVPSVEPSRETVLLARAFHEMSPIPIQLREDMLIQILDFVHGFRRGISNYETLTKDTQEIGGLETYLELMIDLEASLHGAVWAGAAGLSGAPPEKVDICRRIGVNLDLCGKLSQQVGTNQDYLGFTSTGGGHLRGMSGWDLTMNPHYWVAVDHQAAQEGADLRDIFGKRHLEGDKLQRALHLIEESPSEQIVRQRLETVRHTTVQLLGHLNTNQATRMVSKVVDTWGSGPGPGFH